MSILSQEAKKQLGCVLHWTGQAATANAPKAITAAGNATQVLPFPGAGVAVLDGSGDYLSITHADFATGTNNFWVGFWSYYDAASYPADNIVIAGTGYNTNQAWAVFLENGLWDIYLLYRNTGVNSGTNPLRLAMPLKQWFWTVIYRQGNTIYLYIDGILRHYADVTGISYTNGLFQLGYQSPRNNGYYWKGYFSECQFKVNPPSFPTAIPRSQLESDSSTKLLLRFLGSGNTFVDSSPTPKTITAYGDAKQLSSPCGSGVAKFNSATSDYVTLDDSADWAFGSSPFTIEAWIKRESIGSRHVIIGQTNSLGNTGYTSIDMEIQSDNTLYTHIVYGLSNSYSITSTTLINDTNWHHVSMCRDGLVLYQSIDGVVTSIPITNVAVIDSSYKLSVGRYGEMTSGTYFNGYMSDVRITKGVALYKSNFTPSTTPFKPDPYTKLLLHFDGVGQAFYDSSDPPGDNGFPILPDGVTVTPNGTFTSQKMKDGRNVIYFNSATPNSISVGDNDAWYLSTYNWTICCWLNYVDISASRPIFGQFQDTTANIWFIYRNTDGKYYCQFKSGGTALLEFNFTYTPTLNTPIFFAMQRNGATINVYINLVLQTITHTVTFTESTNLANLNADLTIGKMTNASPPYFNGNIKDLMIFKGKALSVDQLAAIMRETFIY